MLRLLGPGPLRVLFGRLIPIACPFLTPPLSCRPTFLSRCQPAFFVCVSELLLAIDYLIAHQINCLFFSAYLLPCWIVRWIYRVGCYRSIVSRKCKNKKEQKERPIRD